MNALSVDILNGCADGWIASLWRACWQGGAAFALVWAVTLLLPRIPARIRCWLWTLAYLKLLTAFLWATPIDLPLLPASPAAPAAARLPQMSDGAAFH